MFSSAVRAIKIAEYDYLRIIYIFFLFGNMYRCGEYNYFKSVNLRFDTLCRRVLRLAKGQLWYTHIYINICTYDSIYNVIYMRRLITVAR